MDNGIFQGKLNTFAASIEKEQKKYENTYGRYDFSEVHKKTDVSEMIPCPFQSLYSDGDMEKGKPVPRPHLEALKAIADRHTRS